MNIFRNELDINDDFLIRQYRGGIILERPKDQDQDQNLKNTIRQLFSMPFSSYFYNANNQIMGVNDVCLMYAPGAPSLKDCIGSTLHRFANKETCALVEAINKSVFKSCQTKIVEESGLTIDNDEIHALSFKFPWYAHDKVIGLFGCSMLVSETPLSEIAKLLTQLVSLRLLGDNRLLLPLYDTRSILCSDLTKRQNEVLVLLLRGKTSKQTGKLLDISYKTVERHIANIKLKTGCGSKSELFDRFA